MRWGGWQGARNTVGVRCREELNATKDWRWSRLLSWMRALELLRADWYEDWSQALEFTVIVSMKAKNRK